MTIDLHLSNSRLSVKLEALHSRLNGRSPTIGELKQALEGRGSAMLLIFLALPFCFIAIPGLSVPFGTAICVIGVFQMLGRDPWLPDFILRRRLSSNSVSQLLLGAAKIASRIEKLIRPRLAFFHAGPGMLRLIGFGIVIAGLGLMLPLPIPFSNSIPAWAVLLLAIGMMEKDGLFVLFGHLTALFAWVFIGLTFAFAAEGFQMLLGFIEA
jgi:hypothetical protein